MGKRGHCQIGGGVFGLPRQGAKGADCGNGKTMLQKNDGIGERMHLLLSFAVSFSTNGPYVCLIDYL